MGKLAMNCLNGFVCLSVFAVAVALGVKWEKAYIEQSESKSEETL